MRTLKVQLKEDEHTLLDTEGRTALTPEELLALLPQLFGLKQAPPLPLATRKYLPLSEYLSDSDDSVLTLSFADIENLLGFTLPASAKKHRAWWSNSSTGHSQAAAWLNPGWKVAGVTRTTVTFQRQKREDMHIITGRVGGKSAGYDLNLIWSAQELKGRIGGALSGSDVNLRIEHGRVQGRVGGRNSGFDVKGILTPERIEIRLGGDVIGADLRIDLHDSTATGRLGGTKLGHDLQLTQKSSEWCGRIGGRFEGKDVVLSSEAPGEIAILAAAITFKALEDDLAAAAGS
ncbi:DUF7662 domain-containing protein [Deinococcus peraridilitoris]|uniref:DUF7662 domain-containing protein n=1 Tax=Deinococcus peraridilitoris (strain DSM 19664 / LMG 22246 / CIP 109416 / KR-200) TaxID=937777 RepID=K9ZXT8_DEIPD|nr:hypothetical protein [Deinococcus peraridilitoris]AFZ66009.1 hypothetical protein Deipe_0409 [Deinococcus peraridilitoris DSM 19664]